mmetsp:Transcript_104496/g.336774  ORF Transcript_104496/g.336774 Transcript_104496/m.336774 type:complete len:201 (+) Transcript_104496:488-1090(+)
MAIGTRRGRRCGVHVASADPCRTRRQGNSPAPRAKRHTISRPNGQMSSSTMQASLRVLPNCPAWKCLCCLGSAAVFVTRAREIWSNRHAPGVLSPLLDHEACGAVRGVIGAPRRGAHLIDHGGLQVNHHAAWHMFAGASLREKRVEGVVATADGLVARHLSIWLNAVLQAEKLPARIANLDTGLADVNADRLTHGCKRGY